MSNDRRVLTLGFGERLEQIEVAVPNESAIPWDANSQLAWVGEGVERLEGRAKVTGQAIYTTDVRLPGMLHAEMIRATHPSATVRAIRIERAQGMPGVRAIHVLAQPGAVVRFEGQELAAVAADTRWQARDAARAIQVDYEVSDHAVSLEAAMQPDAPLVYPRAAGAPGKGALPIEGNLRGPATGGRRFAGAGDVDAAWADAPVQVSGTYQTAVQTHSALEPHGSVVAPVDGGFEIWTSTQSIASVVKDVAQAFDVPRSKVRVHCDHMGGGFGAKFGAGPYTIVAAHLARKTNKPVRLILDRRAEHLAGGNRPSSKQDIRLGATENGTLVALDLTSWGSAGVGTGAGVAAPFHVIYDCPNRRTAEFDVFTHTGASAAFRAPGHPQGVFGLERSMDELAARLGLDPIELRLRNDSHPVRREQWDIARERSGWRDKRAAPKVQGALRWGIGAASSVWYNIVEKGVGATVRIHRDATVELESGVQDIGGGIRTVLAQVVAEVLGLSPSRIEVKIGDSAYPRGPGSGGSKTTASLTPAVHRAAQQAALKLVRASELGTSVDPLDPAAVRLSGGQLHGAAGSISFEQACGRLREDVVVGTGEREDDLGGIAGAKDESLRRLAELIAGAQIAEVVVDTDTGVVRVERVVAVQDCGRVMNSLQAHSQVNGGVIQGVSYALYEERVLDPLTGLMLNPTLDAYRIAGMREIPQIDVVMLDVYSGLNSTGAMGLGEPCTVPTSAAVANAVAHALGGAVHELPLTPERVLAAWQRVRRGGTR